MTQNLKTLQLSNFASTSALILSPTDGSSFILLLPQKFLLFINLKNVPHLLEEKAGMQNDGNTDGNRMYNSKTITITITKAGHRQRSNGITFFQQIQRIEAQRFSEILLWKHYILENEIAQVEFLVKVLDAF